MGSDDEAGMAGGATAGWRPMAFGDRHAREIRDPFYEPLWAGRRAIVDVRAAAVTVRDSALTAGSGPAELRRAIAAATRAEEIVLDGYLLPAPLPGTGDAAIAPAAPGAAASITRGSLLRQFLLGDLVAGRDRAPDQPQPSVALPADGPLAFVAVDLLWLDGQALLDLPLGERKRLLESVLDEGRLVRRSPSVRPPIERWASYWLHLGFRAMAVKAANSRYVPGMASDEWTIAPIPRH